MTERFAEQYIGVHSADAEQVELQYANGSLHLRYVDWQEQQRAAVFKEVLAFRWQEQDESAVPRDDTTYEVLNSMWLASHSVLRHQAIRYAHYKLCFNACSVLDVLCQAITPNSSSAHNGG